MKDKGPYRVKEIFYTLQGEGINTGRPAVFCRFSGCNLWSGREEDRPSAACTFCDTDFVGTNGQNGGVFTRALDLAKHVANIFRGSFHRQGRPFVVCTGGEPALQLDRELVEAFHDCGFEVAVETNGTLPLPPSVDWVCVSPKAGTTVVTTSGDELKLVVPQKGLIPEDYLNLDFRFFLLQPMDGPHVKEYAEMAVRYCLEHPEWRLSVQIHKILGIP